jgi:hypothetical protein
MIIFESTLTTFEASFIFEAAGAVSKIGSSLKSNHHVRFSLPKSLKHTVAVVSIVAVFVAVAGVTVIAEVNVIIVVVTVDGTADVLFLLLLMYCFYHY